MTYVPRQIPTKVANPELQRYLEQELLDISRLLNTLEAASSGVGELVDLSDVNTSTPTNRNVLVADGVDWESRPLVEADISDLQSYALASHNHSGVYAPVSHTHVEADITDLGSYLTAVPATESPLKATEMGSGQNLNNLLANQAGFYYQTANADTPGNNYPSGEAGSLIVQKSAGSATQIYLTYPTSNNKLFYRSYYSSAWGSWVQVARANYGETVSGSWTFSAVPTFSASGIYIGDSNTRVLEGSGNSMRVQTNSGYGDFGPQNTSWCHMNTDRASFYFNTAVAINGIPKRYNQGAIPWHLSSSYQSAGITFSTSSPSGGSSGDIWFKYV